MERSAEGLHASGGALNVTDEVSPQLTRAALDAHPHPPQLAVDFGFPSREATKLAWPQLVAAVASLNGLSDEEVLLTEELVIV